VFVAVLLIDENQFDAAKEYIAAARRGPIFVEEKKLLEEAIAKLNSSPPAASATPPPREPVAGAVISIPSLTASPGARPQASASAPPQGRPLPTPNEP